MPAPGLVVIARLVLVVSIAAVPSSVASVKSPAQTAAVGQSAAVMPHTADTEGFSVAGPPANSHLADSNTIAPPLSAAVTSPGVLEIPAMALTAYRNAERLMTQAMPGCGVSWNLLAGIGRVESMHANEGATDARGTAVNPIYGPALDGSLHGNEVVVDSGASNGRTVYARAMGPMQFLPATWMHYGADGDGDGQANPQNLFDSALSAAHYLCSGGLDLRDQSQMITAVLRYNNSMAYTLNVLGWADGYATGVPPVNLPPITAPRPPISDLRMETNPANVNPVDNGARGTGAGSQDETRTDDRGEDGTPLDQAGGTWGRGTTNAGAGDSGEGSRSGAGGNRGAAKAGKGPAPKVTFGNGRNGGARGTGGAR